MRFGDDWLALDTSPCPPEAGTAALAAAPFGRGLASRVNGSAADAARNVRRVIIGSSLGNGLGDPQVREEVAQLLVGQAVEEPDRHQALAGGLDLLDVRGLEGDVLA